MAKTPLSSKNSACHAELTVASARSLEKLVRADAMRPLRKRMMVATQPLAPAVKQVARRKIHAPGGERRTKSSLSSQVANAVTRSIRTAGKTMAVSINLVGKGNLSNLARAVEGEILWKHPTFGHDPEVTQRPRPFFYATLEALMPKVARDIERVFDDIEKNLLCLL